MELIVVLLYCYIVVQQYSNIAIISVLVSVFEFR